MTAPNVRTVLEILVFRGLFHMNLAFFHRRGNPAKPRLRQAQHACSSGNAGMYC